MNNTTVQIAILVLFTSLARLSPADDHHPIIPGFERFAEVEETTDIERGMLLLNELNCMACHETKSTWAIEPKQAPILTEVGSRVLPEYFGSFIADPHGVKPGTSMPDVLAGKSPNEKKIISESIGQFLASTGRSAKQKSNISLITQGEKLFHSIGCVACHDPLNEEIHLSTSVPLGDLETKYTLPGLQKFISDPLHIRPSGRMPQFNLANKEAQAIASYLLRKVVVDSKINFAYYEGAWEQLPDFDQLKPTSTGTAAGFEMQVGPRKDRFGIVFSGYWKTDIDDKFKFRLGSDDGSKLVIDGKTIITNDGIHPVVFKESECELSAGLHEIRVEFFENSGGEELKVEVYGKGLNGVGLETLMQPTKTAATTPAVDAFVFDPEKAELGKTYFQSLGCVSCHEMKAGGEPVLAKRGINAPSLKSLDLQKGCLHESDSSIRFGLTDDQINCLTAAIKQLKKPGLVTTDPEQTVHEKLVTLNCYACHNRERPGDLIVGGVVDTSGDSAEIYGRKKWFTGTQAEMGDEGQHPPALKSIGAKLNPRWLNKVLTEGVKSRPYMNTRMPRFGGKQVMGELAQQLINVDKLDNVISVSQTEPERKVKAHGRFLAGEDALSCIKCHTFGKYNATGIQAIDLTTMTERLAKDWFQAYMLKPSNFRRGTRMPESWPGGKSFYPDLLEGNAQKQIDALWMFLSDADKAAKPKGLVRSKLELKATDRPIIYRNFIQGAGARAIGVAYPEQTNLAFDAQNCRLALLWQENFIDASRHWTGRGQGFESPLGENVLPLHDTVVFVSELVEGQWPREFSDAQRPKFKGYRFDKDRRPIFKYQIGDVTIEDQPIPVVQDGRPLLKRKFKITSNGPQKIYYLAAMGKKVNAKANSFAVDDRFETALSGVTTSVLKASNGQSALLGVIDLSNGSAEFEQTYDW